MKYAEIARDLRARITGGEFPPGSRIPLREDLLKVYSASNGTLQNAINRLLDEGFLETCGAKGMLVSERPPHLFRMGMTLPGGDSVALDSLWPLFAKCVDEMRGGSAQVEVYPGIGGEMDEASWHRLLDDVENCRIAGLFLNEIIRVPFDRFQALRRNFLPMVIISKEERYSGHKLMRISYDYVKLVHLALERFKAVGRRKVALLLNAEFQPEQVESFTDEVAKSGLETRPEWIQAVALKRQMIPWTANIVRAMFSAARPDALLILNENLLDSALKGLSALSMKPGVDIEVISHCNLPASCSVPAGVARIGFDAKETLSTAFALIDECNGNEIMRKRTLLDPVWEIDYPKGSKQGRRAS